MKDRDEQLLGELARRNWIVLALLLLLSLPWRSLPISGGVLAGGLLAIISYRWLFHSLQKTLGHPTHGAAKGFQITYFIRLGALGTAIFLLVAQVRVHPVALAAGLSVVVVNIFWTTVKRSL